MKFKVEALASNSAARAATFQTLHSTVQTPLFMPVGTQATVKAQRPGILEDAGSQILLANTYHLLLRPGTEVFKRLGGYHGFTSWKASVLTDSGGFQLFSMSDNIDMQEEGATFRSHIDGSKTFLSPEISIETQRAIGSDIMMVLDQCIPSTANKENAQAALDITFRWAKRSLASREDSQQALFGIVQGALFPDLRHLSIEQITSLPLDGFAIGGLAVGESKAEREDICELSAKALPSDKPRYLMGVGTPLDILEAVHRGVDMFDCIIPTQVAQHGTVFTSQGIIKIPRTVYKFSEESLDPDCHCPTCARFSKAYLHHLFKAKEPLSWQLLGQHNIYFYHHLMRKIRSSILNDTFYAFYKEQQQRLGASDPDNPPGPSPKTKTKATELGDYQVRIHSKGFANIRHILSGEIMHASHGPMEEAKSLYIEQSGLADFLLRPQPSPIIIWDVGLGAAANAMAAVQCYEELAHGGPPLAPLHIVSFENDLDSLRLAIRNNRHFPYLRHPGPAALLKKGHWQSKENPNLRWTLIEGDFQQAMESSDIPPPTLIYFDMFSSKTDPLQWSLASFQKLFSHCQNQGTQLFTYSRSTLVRALLLSAGFYVARGTATGQKQETTIAISPTQQNEIPGQRELLGSSWLDRWQRSTAQFPTEMTPQHKKTMTQSIVGHPQFQK